MDFDLLHSQPSVLVHAEVVQNFSRRFSVRIFHFGVLGFRWSDWNACSRVASTVAIGRGARVGVGGGWNSSNFHRWTSRRLSLGRSPVPPEEKKHTSGSAVQTLLLLLLLLCWSSASATSSPSEGVLCLCRGGPPLRCWALPPALPLAPRTWAQRTAAQCAPFQTFSTPSCDVISLILQGSYLVVGKARHGELWSLQLGGRPCLAQGPHSEHWFKAWQNVRSHCGFCVRPK